MPYQLGDRDLALFAQVSRDIAKVKEEARERDEHHKMRYEDQRSKMVHSVEKLKKHYNTNVMPEIPRVMERKQMAKEDADANLLREIEKIRLEKEKKLAEAERDLKNRVGMINEDYRSSIVRLDERLIDIKINEKLRDFMRQNEKIDKKDPEADMKLFAIAIEQKNYLENLLKENKMTPTMRKKIHTYLHGPVKDYLSDKNNNVYSTKMI